MLNISRNMWNQAKQRVTDDPFPSNARIPRPVRYEFPPVGPGSPPSWTSMEGLQRAASRRHLNQTCEQLQLAPSETNVPLEDQTPRPGSKAEPSHHSEESHFSHLCLESHTCRSGRRLRATGESWNRRWTSLFFPVKAKWFVASGYPQTQRRRQIAVDVRIYLLDIQ